MSVSSSDDARAGSGEAERAGSGEAARAAVAVVEAFVDARTRNDAAGVLALVSADVVVAGGGGGGGGAGRAALARLLDRRRSRGEWARPYADADADADGACVRLDGAVTVAGRRVRRRATFHVRGGAICRIVLARGARL